MWWVGGVTAARAAKAYEAMNPPSIDVKDIIDADSAIGLTFPTDLFVAEMPPEPNACVCVFDSGGPPPDAHLTYEKPFVQVRVRGEVGGYQTAHELAQAIRDLLNGYANQTVNSARYIGIWAETDVLSLGLDDNRRPQLSVNFRIHRTDT